MAGLIMEKCRLGSCLRICFCIFTLIILIKDVSSHRDGAQMVSITSRLYLLMLGHQALYDQNLASE